MPARHLRCWLGRPSSVRPRRLWWLMSRHHMLLRTSRRSLVLLLLRSGSWSCRSLTSQGVDGGKACSAAGGIDPGRDADDEGDAEGADPGDRGDGHRLAQKMWQDLGADHAKGYAEHTAHYAAGAGF